MALLDRLGAAERQQAAAGDQHRIGAARLLDGLAAELDDVLLALLARLAEAEQAEALQRQHLEAGTPEEIGKPVVDLVGIGGGDRDALGADARSPSTTASVMVETGSPVSWRSFSSSCWCAS